jgi:DNA processing protein
VNNHDPNALRELLLAWTTLPFLTRARLRVLLGLELAGEPVCRLDAAALSSTLGLPLPEAVQVVGLSDPAAASRAAAARAGSAVTIVDSTYPERLRATADAPLVLFQRGDVSLLDRLAVAVVGSRKASPYGVNVAEMLARGLASHGVAVVSGLAWGIDAAAHRAALETGVTIAVLGTGIDVAYPRSNQKLQERIAERGLLLSEFPPGTTPQPHHFPVRNRIIAGLASAVIVVEATARSGSLITARLAAEEGRDVMAVPGSVFGEGSAGAHRLIQDGAKLVTCAEDVLDELPGFERRETAGPRLPDLPDDPELARVCGAIPPDNALHPDFLAPHASSPGRLCEILLDLELAGWIRKVKGGAYVRVAR